MCVSQELSAKSVEVSVGVVVARNGLKVKRKGWASHGALGAASDARRICCSLVLDCI